ncbi:hypothetical protein IT409_00455 [Candidatus Falkowbacteria bacterium]|nr:hypothetical protein [Candidatus Falkowbacteria bacterium]
MKLSLCRYRPSVAQVLMAIIVTAFVVSAASLIDVHALLFSWPDEMSNWFFISSQSLKVSQPLDLVATNLVTPRSMTLASHFLVPVGFVGIPLVYGLLYSILGAYVLYVTPLLAGAGIVAMYVLLRRAMGDWRLAVSGAVLVATLPAYWYYAHFSLLPNIVVCALALIAFAVTPKLGFGVTPKPSLGGAVGLLLALITLIRPLEMLWIGFLYLLYALYYKKQIPWSQYVLVIAPVIVASIGLLAANRYLYGSPLAFGYFHTISQNSSQAIQASLPFTFNLKALGHVFLTYLISTHWHYFALASFGVVSAYFAWSKKLFWYYISAVVGVFVIVSALYGTYAYPDTFITQISVLGISYNRYYLPFFLLLIPFITQFVSYLITTSRATLIILIATLFVVVGVNYSAVYGKASDSIPRIKQSIHEYESIRDAVLRATPTSSVIVTTRGDKIVFPHRQVISQYDPSILDGFEALRLEGISLYYMGYKDERPANLTISNPQELGYGYFLYTISHE